QRVEATLKGRIWQTQASDREAAVWMVACDIPYRRRSPIMPDPNRPFHLETVNQLNHVLDDQALGIGFVRLVQRRPTMSAHIWRYCAESERSEHGQLVTPAQRQFRPSMQKDDRRSILRTTGEIERRMTRCRECMFGNDRHFVCSYPRDAPKGCIHL